MSKPPTILADMVQDWVFEAAVEHMRHDDVLFDVALYPMPTDTGWTPSLFVYLMLQPVGDVDGEHRGEFMSPSGLTKELVAAFVAQFAEDTVNVRQALNAARQSGASPKPGVAVADLEG